MKIVRITAIASYLVGMALFVNDGFFSADKTNAQASPTPAPAAFLKGDWPRGAERLSP